MSRTRGQVARAVLAAAFGAALGCGSDDSTQGIVTGLPAEQKLSTLTDEDVQQACRSINEGAALVVNPSVLQRVACLPYGLRASATESNGAISVNVSQCQQVVDACVSDAQNGEVDSVEAGLEADQDDCSDASADDVRGCEVTVGEYETCFNLLLSELQRRLDEMTCQNAEMLSTQEYDGNVDAASIPQCKAIMTACPDAELGIATAP